MEISGCQSEGQQREELTESEKSKEERQSRKREEADKSGRWKAVYQRRRERETHTVHRVKRDEKGLVSVSIFLLMPLWRSDKQAHIDIRAAEEVSAFLQSCCRWRMPLLFLSVSVSCLALSLFSKEREGGLSRKMLLFWCLMPLCSFFVCLSCLCWGSFWDKNVTANALGIEVGGDLQHRRSL